MPKDADDGFYERRGRVSHHRANEGRRTKRLDERFRIAPSKTLEEFSDLLSVCYQHAEAARARGAQLVS